MNLGDDVREIDPSQLQLHDKFILARTQEMARNVREQIDAYDIGTAARGLYDFVWGDICDWYVEMSKPALKGDEGESRKHTTQGVIEHVFRTVLPLLHPFIPFVTEELWSAFGFNDDYIMRSSWPEPVREYIFEGASDDMRILQEAVRTLRNLRAEAHIPPQQKLSRAVIRVAPGTRTAEILRASLDQICGLCKVESVILESPSGEWGYGPSLSGVSGDAEVKLPVGDVLDVPEEIARLEKEVATIMKAVAASEARLGKADFVARAPAEVVEKERGKVSEGKAQIERLRANIESLSK